jgi:hypothetical protein
VRRNNQQANPKQVTSESEVEVTNERARAWVEKCVYDNTREPNNKRLVNL